MKEQQNYTLTSIEGIKVGHAHDEDALTGCTVVLCENGMMCGVDQRGGAPGTRETDLLHPMHLVQEVHAVLLSGGSAFGLAAADGVMRYLYEHGIGYETGVTKVPIVPAAVIFDLGVGIPTIFPTAEMGYRACLNASSQPVLEGNVGAGIGATVAKIQGMNHAMKAGVGSSCVEIGKRLKVAALVVLNALGEVIDPCSAEILAGVRQNIDNLHPPFQFVSTLSIMEQQLDILISRGSTITSNTTIGIIATNARLNKEEVNKVAQMAHNGLARAVRPAHTMFDGDTIFALASGQEKADVNLVGAFSAEAVAIACKRAVITARSIRGLPGLAQFTSKPGTQT